MERIVNRIIECENQEYDEFMDYQVKYLERFSFTQSWTSKATALAVLSLIPMFFATAVRSFSPGFCPSPFMVVACSPLRE